MTPAIIQKRCVVGNAGSEASVSLPLPAEHLSFIVFFEAFIKPPPWVYLVDLSGGTASSGKAGHPEQPTIEIQHK